MSAQTSYGFATSRGIAGGLFDLAPYSIDSRLNSEGDGVLKFGMGVVQGANPGTNVKKPISTSTKALFEGIALNGFSTQQNMAGEVNILENQTVGVLRYGRCWARVPSGVTPAYGNELHLIIAGNDAGCFTSAAVAANSIIAVNGRFIGTAQNGLAPVELFAQADYTERGDTL